MNINLSFCQPNFCNPIFFTIFAPYEKIEVPYVVIIISVNTFHFLYFNLNQEIGTTPDTLSIACCCGNNTLWMYSLEEKSFYTKLLDDSYLEHLLKDCLLLIITIVSFLYYTHKQLGDMLCIIAYSSKEN